MPYHIIEELQTYLIAQGVGQSPSATPSATIPSIWIQPRDGARLTDERRARGIPGRVLHRHHRSLQDRSSGKARSPHNPRATNSSRRLERKAQLDDGQRHRSILNRLESRAAATD